MWDNPFLVMELVLPAIDRVVADIGELTNSDDPFDRELACAILAGAESETFYTLMADHLQEIDVPELTTWLVVTTTQDAYADLHSKRCITATDVPQPPRTPLAATPRGAQFRAGTQLAIQDGDTLEPGATADYDTDPPTSGPSWAEGAPWGVRTEQQPNEAVVRNLRNGAVVFNYALADESAVADLRAFVEGLDGYPDCYVMQPHSAVPDGAVSLAAWGWTTTAAPDDTAAMQAFVNDHRANGPDSPDGGGCGG